MFDANWTWSHFIDDASDPETTLNEVNLYDLGAEKASSSFDHRHRGVASFIYEIRLARDSSGWVNEGQSEQRPKTPRTTGSSVSLCHYTHMLSNTLHCTI